MTPERSSTGKPRENRCTGMFGMGECTNFGTPKKRLFWGVTGFYGALGGALARYSALVGGLERPFRFKCDVQFIRTYELCHGTGTY